MTIIAKKILLILLPLIVILAVYLAFDPFEVVYSYKSHYNDPRINYNWDFNQTETLLQNQAERCYDSFIFGNSRSAAFITSDWSKFTGSSSTLHFAAMNESLYGIHRKFVLLSKEKVPLKNALVILDSQLLSMASNSSGHLFIKHPLLSGESPLSFQLTFFRAFMEIPYFIAYVDYKMTGKVRPAFQKKFSEGIRYAPVTGDKFQDRLEKLIAENSEKYYKDRSAVFYRRNFLKQESSAPVIKPLQLKLLAEMKKIFDDNRTDYRIVVGPNYDQKQLGRNDLSCLKDIFGAERVFDYSGVNPLTGDIHNYYEDSHYRPLVARQIMEGIYDVKGGSDGR